MPFQLSCTKTIELPGLTLAIAGVAGLVYRIIGREIQVVDPAGKVVKRWPTGHTDEITAFGASKDGLFLATGSEDNEVHLHSVAEGAVKKVFRGHEGFVFGVAVNSTGSVVISGSRDRTVRVWAEERVPGVVARGHTGGVYGICFLRGETTFASGSYDETLCVWDLSSHCLRTVQVGFWVRSLSDLSPCGTRIAVGSDEGLVLLYDCETWERLWEVQAHSDRVRAITFSHNGLFLATGSIDESAKILSAETGQIIKTCRGHKHSVLSVSFTPCGTTLITGSEDETIRFWPIHSAETLILASFFHGSRFEKMVNTYLRRAQDTAYDLAKDQLIPRMKRILFAAMAPGDIEI